MGRPWPDRQPLRPGPFPVLINNNNNNNNNTARLKCLQTALVQPREGTNKIPASVSVHEPCQGFMSRSEPLAEGTVDLAFQLPNARYETARDMFFK